VNGGNPALLAWLEERIGSRGPIPFSDFMEAALYHPAHGYYCRPGAGTGPAGDFYTSPDLHPAFGTLVSRQIAQILEKAAQDDGPVRVIEAGPGSGRLARDIMAGLGSELPDLARRATYTLVEVSPSMRQAQERILGDAGAAHRWAGVEWASWSSLIERAGGGRFAGCVVANEFVDALPVHVVEQSAGELREIYVTLEAGSFRELLLEPSTGRLARHLSELGVSLKEGQRAEVCLKGLDWVSSLGRLFGEEGRGGVILIDYGHPAKELYDSTRHRGTLLSYHRHRVTENLYARVGEQDMTAHVDFTSVERRAREAGFDAAPLTTQMRFLVSLGLARMLADLSQSGGPALVKARDQMALHGLTAPGGMGEVFKVLLLAKGMKASNLIGAADPFRSAR